MTEIYMIKQIDNSRLTREIDVQRSKECMHLLFLGIGCLLILLFLCLQHFRALRSGYETEQLKKELAQLEEMNQRLKVECAHLKDPQRIVPLAKQLGLQEPSSEQIVVWQGGFPSEPAATLVASTDKQLLAAAEGREQTLR